MRRVSELGIEELAMRQRLLVNPTSGVQFARSVSEVRSSTRSQTSYGRNQLMSAKVERKYGGFTSAQLRTMAEAHKGREDAKILIDLLDDIDALQADELLPRMRRIETKLHKMAIKLGAEPEDSTTMTISVQEWPDHVNVGVSGHDVTLAQIRRALEEHNVDDRRMIRVCTGGQGTQPIATLYLTPRD